MAIELATTPKGHGPVTTVSAPSGLLFLSGVGPASTRVNPAQETDPVPEDIQQQVNLTLAQLKSVLATQGLGPRHIAKLLVYLTDGREFDLVRTAIQDWSFGWTPALTFIAVDNLPTRGARVQLDAIAAAD